MEPDETSNDVEDWYEIDVMSSSSDFENDYEVDQSIPPEEDLEFDSDMEADDCSSDVGDGYEIDWISSSSDLEADDEMDPTIPPEEEIEFDLARTVRYCTELHVVSTMTKADAVRINSLLGFGVYGASNISKTIQSVQRSPTSVLMCLLTSLH